MKEILRLTLILTIVSIIHAEEDATNPPLGYNANQQGGSHLYPSLNGVTDFSNRNGYNNYYGPGQTGNNANSGSRYPYQQPGNPQPYPVGTGPYNMTYSGYPGNRNLNNSYQTYPSNNQQGQGVYRPGTSVSNPHQGFGNPKPILNPHQPFGTPGGSINNQYGSHRNDTRPYNPTNRNPSYPTNPSYPNSPNYPNNMNYPSPNNPSYRNNSSYPNYPNNQGYGSNGASNHSSYPRQPASNPGYPSNPGYGSNFGSSNHSSYPRQPSTQGFPSNSGYGTNFGSNGNSNYAKQPVRNNDPHRPFGRPAK